MKESTKSNFIIIFLGSLLLFVIGMKLFVNLSTYKDILCWDEAAYMFRGLNIMDKVPKGWGPLYGFWYFLLGLSQMVTGEIDLVKLNYLNFKILAISGPILLYTLMILKRVHPIAAFVICAGYMMCSVNTSTWPHISHFTVVFLLAGLIKSHFFKSRFIQWCIILTTVFLTSYARPELFLAFILLLGAFAIFVIIKRFKFNKWEYAIGLFAFAFIFLFQFKMGISMFASTEGGTGEYSRDLFAFGQHFAINYAHWNDLNLESWRYWIPIFEENFEGKEGLFSAGLSNKPMFVKHISSNIGRLLYNSLDYISDSVFLGKLLALPFWLKMIFLGFFLAIGIYIGRSFKNLVSYLYNSEQGFMLMVLLFFAAPTYIACVLIYARDHYIILQMPFYLCAIAFVFFIRDKGSNDYQLNGISILLLGSFIFLFAPNKDKIKYFDLWQNKSETHNIKAIRQLQSYDYSGYNKENPLNLLENEGGLSIYTMKQEIMSGIPPINSDSLSINELLKEKAYDVIFVTPSMIHDPLMITYDGWSSFIANPEAYQFRKEPIKNSNASYFLIKDGVLE